MNKQRQREVKRMYKDMDTRQRAVKKYMINQLLSFSCFYGTKRKTLQRLSYKEVYHYYMEFML